MPEKAIISHHGEKYEIGRGKRFYGIWVVGAPYDAPVDRWPETRDGWGQAWMRFAAIEVPGTITAAAPKRTGLRSLPNFRRGAHEANHRTNHETRPAEAVAARRRGGTALLVGEGLLVVGVVLGLAGLFPAYDAGKSLISQNEQVVPHLCYVIAWAVSAGLIALCVSRPRTARLGALFALGLSAVTFGLFLGDLGEVTSDGASLGLGLVVSLLGWLACTAGATLALVASSRDAYPVQSGLPQSGMAGAGMMKAERGWPARPTRGHAGPLALLVLAGIGTAAAFAPSWDSYTATQASTGSVVTQTLGNAFSNPAVIIAGNVAVMVAIIAVAALAALWRPATQGALLLAGAIVPLVAQAISALIQISQPAYNQAQAQAQGLTITSGMTPVFWVYCVFVIALLISCAWLLTAPRESAIGAMPMSPWLPSPSGEGDRPPSVGYAAEGGVADDDASDDDASDDDASDDDASDDASDGDASDDDAADNEVGEGGAGDGEHSAYA